jgi:hypothetical protein
VIGLGEPMLDAYPQKTSSTGKISPDQVAVC